ncbi:hypothetical protein QQ045_026441 [Rhodiola kirilowii]
MSCCLLRNLWISNKNTAIMADFQSQLKLQFPFLELDPNMEQLLAQFTQPNMEFQGFASSECSNQFFFSQSQTTEFHGNSFPTEIFPQSDILVSGEVPPVLSASTTTTRLAPTRHGEEVDCMKKRKAVEVSEGSSGISSSLAPTSAKNNRKGKKVKVCSGDEIPKDVVHVRARRGQATDSHSLAERVRRGKINERLKCLQDIVPGCYKTMGMAVMLDEIINYVQSLQNQVEFLSMRLTAASTFHDFSIETDHTAESLQRAKAAEMEKLIKDVNAGIACFQQQMWPQ